MKLGYFNALSVCYVRLNLIYVIYSVKRITVKCVDFMNKNEFSADYL